jgi:hypothetical protein
MDGHPSPQWIRNRHLAALRSEPLLNGVRDPFEGIKPAVAMYLTSGTRAEAWCAGFTHGALDGLREAYRQCCPECRKLITPIAAMYQRAREEAA